MKPLSKALCISPLKSFVNIVNNTLITNAQCNSNPKVLGLSPSIAVHVSHSVTKLNLTEDYVSPLLIAYSPIEIGRLPCREVDCHI